MYQMLTVCRILYTPLKPCLCWFYEYFGKINVRYLTKTENFIGSGVEYHPPYFICLIG